MLYPVYCFIPLSWVTSAFHLFIMDSFEKEKTNLTIWWKKLRKAGHQHRSDHYFSSRPDALYVLDELWKLRDTGCIPRCAVVSIAHHKVKLADSKDSYQKYFAGQWVGSRDNIGLVLDHDMFKVVNGCADTFCGIDDYNWYAISTYIFHRFQP